MLKELVVVYVNVVFASNTESFKLMHAMGLPLDKGMPATARDGDTHRGCRVCVAPLWRRAQVGSDEVLILYRTSG